MNNQRMGPDLAIGADNEADISVLDRLEMDLVADPQSVELSRKYIRLAEEYNEESIMSITNVLTDVSTMLTWTYLATRWRP